jgi:DNA-binding NtrC family response regulator
LRFLQDGTYKPLGADHFVLSDVRIIAATNRKIEALLAEGKFRSDLYYRLNVLGLDLPPLRERRADISLLASHFLTRLCAPSNPTAKFFSAAALQMLTCYDWPGNVRELFNVVQRAFVFAETSQILPCHISIRECVGLDELSGPFGDARARTIAAFERRYVEEMIRKHKGNVTHAAREAGKERRAFGRMLKKYGIDRVSPRPVAGSLNAHLQDPQTKRN